MDALQEDDDAQMQGIHETECEVLELREQIAMLTKQFYQERQQWLEEKRRLEEAAKPLQSVSSLQSQRTDDSPGCASSRHAHQRLSSGALLGCEAGSESVREDASQSGLSVKEPCISFSSSFQSTRSGSPSQTDCVALSFSATSMRVSGGNSELLLMLADLQRQLEESRRQQESASVRWALEREALQRQVHAVISMSAEAGASLSTATSTGTDCLRGGGDGSGSSIADGATRGSPGYAAQEHAEERLYLSKRVSELEILVEELQAERDNLEEQLRMLAADAARAKRATRGTAELAPSSLPSPLRTSAAATEPPPPPAAARCGGDGNGGSLLALAQRDSVSVTDLLGEKAVLERELRRYREDCVAVPRAEYAELRSLSSQMAFLQSEIEQLREEADEAGRMRAAAEAELATAFQDCVAVPRGEYEQLLRLDAESRAREAVSAIEAASPAALHRGTQPVPLEEHRRLLAAVQERDALAVHITDLQRRLLAAEPQVQAQQEAVTAQNKEAAAAAGAGATADANTSAATAATAAAGVAAMQFELTALREQLAAAVAAAVGESSRLGLQVSELQEEVEVLRNQNVGLMAEVGAARQALASGQVQASDDVRNAAAAAKTALTAAVEELRKLRGRVAALEAELGETRRAAETAQAASSDNLAVELAAVREAALRTSQALSSCLHLRHLPKEGEAEGAVEGAVDMTMAMGAGAIADGAAMAVPPPALGCLSGTDSRLRALEGELAAVRRAEEAARAERDALLGEAEAARQALAQSLAVQEAAELAAVNAAEAAAATARELDKAKLELAEARELGLLFQCKRDLLQPPRRVVRGLPPEWLTGGLICATTASTAALGPPTGRDGGSGGSGGGGGGAVCEPLGPGGVMASVQASVEALAVVSGDPDVGET